MKDRMSPENRTQKGCLSQRFRARPPQCLHHASCHHATTRDGRTAHSLRGCDMAFGLRQARCFVACPWATWEDGLMRRPLERRPGKLGAGTNRV